MRILITGATGYVGATIAERLAAKGHTVIGTARDRAAAFAARPHLDWIGADFNRDLDPYVWRTRFYAIDAVINCVGAWHESADNTFEAVHALAPIALFQTCARLGVKRVIHFSMLGHDRVAESSLLATKRIADHALASLDLDWAILAPGLIWGADAPLARFLANVATWPVVPTPSASTATLHDLARVAPIRIDDVCDAVLRLLEPSAPVRCYIPLVGPESMSTVELCQRVRAAVGQHGWRSVAMPDAIARVCAALAKVDRQHVFGTELMKILSMDLTASTEPLVDLLGHAPARLDRRAWASAANRRARPAVAALRSA
ncbi:MAG: NAD-dependent epimerase/dehydratase family protein [Burkholderiales bacterium]